MSHPMDFEPDDEDFLPMLIMVSVIMLGVWVVAFIYQATK